MAIQNIPDSIKSQSSEYFGEQFCLLAILEILKIRQRSLIGASEPTEAPRNTLMTDKSRLDVDPSLHLTLRQFKGIEIRDKCFSRTNKYPLLIFISHLESSIRVLNWISFSTSTCRVKYRTCFFQNFVTNPTCVSLSDSLWRVSV